VSNNRLAMGKQDITTLLHALDNVLHVNNQNATIYVIGGANIALTVSETRMTTDIDVVIEQGEKAILEGAEKISKIYNSIITNDNLHLTNEELVNLYIQPDWINNQFTGGPNQKPGFSGITWYWFDNKDSDNRSTLFNGKNLRVVLASPEMLLALKCFAQREKDLPDIYTLMRITGIKTPQDLTKNIYKFTGQRFFDEQTKPWMPHHLDFSFKKLFQHAPDDLKLPTPETLGNRIRKILGVSPKTIKPTNVISEQNLENNNDIKYVNSSVIDEVYQKTEDLVKESYSEHFPDKESALMAANSFDESKLPQVRSQQVISEQRSYTADIQEIAMVQKYPPLGTSDHDGYPPLPSKDADDKSHDGHQH